MTIHINTEKVKECLNKFLYYYDLPGLAVSIGYGDKTYLWALGYQNALTKAPLHTRHIFHMGSVTKTLVGTSILQLWEKGSIDLGKKLITYLPTFKMADSRYRDITLRHLLAHTSGMPDVKDYHWESPQTDDTALERYVYSDEVKNAHLLWAPEEGKFSYSNMAYEVLGLVIASVTKKTFEDYVTENIFHPLEMNNSTLLTFRRDMSEVCAPHIKTPENHFALAPHFPYNRSHGPSSTLTSNLEDLGKWAKANLHKKILKPATYKTAWEKQALVPNNGEHICLSWFCRKQNNYVFYGHEGTDDGFRTSFWLCPELNLYIIVCSNLTKAPVKKISKQLFDNLINEKFI